jgi:large conductance mechanosensitive channel
MGLRQEFQEFAVKGNAIDLAVGVIVGGAFGKIVDSVIKDLIMPVVGRFVGGLDFSDLFLPLADAPAGIERTLAAYRAAGVPVFAYGAFVTVFVNFLILAWIVFLMVKAINKAKRKEAAAPAAPAPPAEDVVLLREIRDALKAGR